MKKIIYFLCLFLGLCICVNAQETPEWVDSDIREFLYPKDKYLTGYSEQIVNNKKLLPYITEQTKNNAQTNLIESIYLKIKSNTVSQVESSSVNGNYTENETYNSQTSKSVLANVNGMQVQTFYDKKSKFVYAFAYVSREDLSKYYNNSLAENLQKLNGLIQTTKHLRSQNDFKAARIQSVSAKNLIVDIENTQSLLLSMNDAVYAKNTSIKSEFESAKNEILSLDALLDVKYEKISNLENKIKVNIEKVEARIELANQLISQGEKNAAKSQCEEGVLFIDEIKKLQNSLVEVDSTISSEKLHKTKVDALESELSLMLSKLSQSNKVFLNSSEDLFGKSVNVIKNKLKSELSILNCSFVENEEEADYKIVIESEVRESSATNNLVFCFADVSVTVYDLNKDMEVFSDFLTVKGGSSSIEKAGHKAMQSSVNQIVENISKYIK